MDRAIPAQRVRTLHSRPVNPAGHYVLYWMIAQRRTRWNFALEHAVSLARDRRQPLLVLEPLRSDHRWANARTHRFVMDGMLDNRARCERAGVGYHGYVEPAPGEGRGLLERLARDASSVVTDDWPSYFLPRMVAAVSERLPVRLELIDGCGLLPLTAAVRAFPSARGFRRHAHDRLITHLTAGPAPDPLARANLQQFPGLPAEVLARWPGELPELVTVRIDQTVAPVATHGGERAARKILDHFLESGLDRYHEERNNLDDDASSGLSPYLHFGHISPHQIAWAVLDRTTWDPGRITPAAAGAREGFWGVPPGHENFLDQLLTWRELGFNMAAQRTEEHDQYESLPEWARATLDAHAGDERPHLYTEDELEQARTHDPLWNAAQRQLTREGRMHNYLRMLWGKKILEWTPSPRQALETLIELNNRWALDGRDPNSYSGIFWTLGRYDRPWFPMRPIFGCVRYMSSASAMRKLRTAGYLARYADGAEQASLFNHTTSAFVR